MLRREIYIWLFFLSLNTLLFLPRYLMEVDSSSFFPYQGFLYDDLYSRFKYIFNRTNYDIFRLNVDLFILIFGGWYFQRHINSRLLSILTGIWYIVIFFYLIYFNSFNKIYLTDPLFYNDVHLLSLGFFNIVESNGWISWLVIFCSIALIIFLYKLASGLVRLAMNTPMGNVSKVSAFIIVFFLLINSIQSGFTFHAHHSFQFITTGIIHNLKNSYQASHRLNNFDTQHYPYHYQNFKLNQKPNIYVLFIESYGKIVYDNPAVSKVYLPTIHKCEHQLDSAGWEIASKLSTAPVSGGSSWISYSSFLYGFNIKNEGTYLSLLSRPDIEKFPHMMQYFRSMGYVNYRLNAIPENEKMKIPWTFYSKFYAIDRWIFFKEMSYKGKLYGFGPSPPDQFSLAFAHDFIRKQAKKPFTLFFITQSSHNPFLSPKEIAQDWRSLNTGIMQKKQHSVFLKKPTAEDYANAIRYQMLMITDFITLNGTDEDIFIVIGDHQPPLITPGIESGFETPVHIISRNKAFISKFSSFGFENRLEIKQRSNFLKHEGLYSLFMHPFLFQYGDSSIQSPPWLPNGAFSNY